MRDSMSDITYATNAISLIIFLGVLIVTLINYYFSVCSSFNDHVRYSEIGENNNCCYSCDKNAEEFNSLLYEHADERKTGFILSCNNNIKVHSFQNNMAITYIIFDMFAVSALLFNGIWSIDEKNTTGLMIGIGQACFVIFSNLIIFFPFYPDWMF